MGAIRFVRAWLWDWCAARYFRKCRTWCFDPNVIWPVTTATRDSASTYLKPLPVWFEGFSFISSPLLFILCVRWDRPFRRSIILRPAIKWIEVGRVYPRNKIREFWFDLIWFFFFNFISGMVGFNYVIEMVPDKKYGALDPETGEWNGVVRQILEKVRFDRRVVVFFFFLNNSARFCMNLKIVKKPKRSKRTIYWNCRKPIWPSDRWRSTTLGRWSLILPSLLWTLA